MTGRFAWNVNKDAANRRKHGVSFSQASEVFFDPFVGSKKDDRHPVDEQRFFTVGMTKAGRLLAVGHTDDGTEVRIVTARDATATERRQYEDD